MAYLINESNDIRIQAGDANFDAQVAEVNVRISENNNEGLITSYVQHDSNNYTSETMLYQGWTMEASNGSDATDLNVYPDRISRTKNGVDKNIQPIAIEDNYTDDAAAAAGGIAIGELYHTDGAVKVRLA